jgi:DNA replication protein DnaC
MSATCPQCGGSGVLVSAGRDTARAERCACQGVCAACQGTGFQVEERNGRRFRGACPVCHNLDRRLTLFNAARIPRRFAGKSLAGFDAKTGEQRTVKMITREVSDTLCRGAEGLLLAGPPGVGKTHLLVALLTQATLQLGLDAVFVDFFALLSDLRTAFGRGQSEGDLLDPILAHSLIGIDELGKGKNTEWEASVLDQLISRAYNTERTLLVTTNYLPAQRHASVQRRLDETLEARVGDRVASRLYEMCRVLVIDGDDQRQRRKKL